MYNYNKALWDIAQRNEEIVLGNQKVKDIVTGEYDYHMVTLRPDALSLLWAKAADVKNKSE